MTAAAQSSPEDIDTWTRGYAEEQARLSGVSVREWIEQFVAQTAAGAETTSAEIHEDPALEPWDLEDIAEAPPQHAEAPAEAEEEPDWIARASAAFAIVEAQTVEEAPAAPAEVVASAPAADEPQDSEFEHVLDELASQVDVVRAQMTARLRESSARRLDGIERALRGMREQIQAAEQGAAEGAVSADETLSAPSPYFAVAVEARAIEAARVVELLDSGFERLEASSARQMAGLRADIEQLFDTLTTRIDHLEQGAPPAVVENDAQPAPTLAVIDSPPPAEAEIEQQPQPAVAAAPEPHAEPSPFDSDLFDDFPEPAAPTLRELLTAAPVTAEESVQPEAPVAPFPHEQADFAAPASADRDMVDSDDDWAAAGVDAWDHPAEPLPLTIRAPEQSAGQGQAAAAGGAKTSIFSLFGRGQIRLRKSA